MPYTVPTFIDIRESLLRDIRNLLPGAATGEDSDWFIRASSVASCAEGLYAHQAWIVRQIFPDTADTEYLEQHAALRNVIRKPAVAAGGTIQISGVSGAILPSGSAFTAQIAGQTVEYTTVRQAVIGENGAGLAPASAVVAGVGGNSASGIAAIISGPPVGVNADAVIVEMVGGTQRETDAELLARLLELIRRPPAGGNKHDYRRWAMEVAGVTNAYAYPLRRGLGTVDIAVVSAGGLPSEDTLQAVRDHIESVRPVTARNVVVFAPAERTVSIRVQVRLQGTTVAEVTPQIETALADQISRLVPGEAWVRSQAEALVSNITGIVDRTFITPVSNVVPVVDGSTVEWLRLGGVMVEAMP